METGVPEGITEHIGADARQHDAETVIRATLGAATDLLARLPELVREKGPAVAFGSDYVSAAARQRAVDQAAHVQLRDALRGTKRFSALDMRDWLRAIEACERAFRSRESEVRGQADIGMSPRRSADLLPDFLAHYPDPVEVNGVTYQMEPGRLFSTRVRGRGGSVVEELARFSAIIAEVVLDVEAPGAAPRIAAYVLSVVLAGEDQVRQVEIGADEWLAMRWPEVKLPCPCVAPGGPKARDHLRAAIERLSTGTIKRHRFRYLGWTHHEGRPVYLHAGGAIAANGEVDGLRTEPVDARIRRFTLPSLENFEVARDAGALVALLEHEPRDVWVSLVGHATRAAMGDARTAVHLTGRSGLGKSTVIACVAQCFGASFGALRPLLSWRQKGTTVQGILETLAVARDVLVPLDDLVHKPEVMAKAVQVIPSHFEQASQAKGLRHGGVRTLAPSQGAIGSSGEELPPEPSVRNRIQLLHLDVRPTPHPTQGDSSAAARGSRGESARGMAAFIRWWAARYEELRPQLTEMERKAAHRWFSSLDARAADVLGAPALGLEMLFEFLTEIGAIDAAKLRGLRDRAMAAMRDAARSHMAHVEEESHWRRFLDLVGDAIRSGKAYAPRITQSGRRVAERPPPDHTHWGYEDAAMPDGSYQPRAKGAKIALTHHARPGAVLILPGAALRLARELAHGEGRELPVGVDALARELVAAGVLRSQSKGRAHGRAKWSCGADLDVEGFEVAAVTLGLPAGADTLPVSDEVGAMPVLPPRGDRDDAEREARDEREAIIAEGRTDGPDDVAGIDPRRPSGPG